MSVNFNRARKSKCLSSREYLLENYEDPYFYEGREYYRKRPHWMFKRPKKRLLFYQVRMYRTWKHNRKTQWKTS